MVGGDIGDLDLRCACRGEADREHGSLSIAGLDGGLAGIRWEAAWPTSESPVGSHGGFARSGCGWSLSLLERSGGVGGRSKGNSFEDERSALAIVFGMDVKAQSVIVRGILWIYLRREIIGFTVWCLTIG